VEAKLVGIRLLVGRKGALVIERHAPPTGLMDTLLGPGDPVTEVVDYMRGKCDELARDLESRYGVAETGDEE